MRADPKGVVEHLRRAEREGDEDLADFLAGEIVAHLERLDGIEERGEPCVNCVSLRAPSEGTREPEDGCPRCAMFHVTDLYGMADGSVVKMLHGFKNGPHRFTVPGVLPLPAPPIQGETDG